MPLKIPTSVWVLLLLLLSRFSDFLTNINLVGEVEKKNTMSLTGKIGPRKKWVEELDSRSKKIHSVTSSSDLEIAELRTSFSIELLNFMDKDEVLEPEVGVPVKLDEDFSVNGIPFNLHIFPIGIVEDSEYAAIRLVNRGTKNVRLKYGIKLICYSNEKNNIVYNDDEIVIFEKNNLPNDQWGCDEFILTNVLLDINNGFYYKNKLLFEIEIEMYEKVDIDLHPLAKAVKEAPDNDNSTLIQLADDDLALITKKLPLEGKSSSEIIRDKQDNIMNHFRELHKINSPVKKK